MAKGHPAVDAMSSGFTFGFTVCASLMAAAAVASVALPGRANATTAT